MNDAYLDAFLASDIELYLPEQYRVMQGQGASCHKTRITHNPLSR